MSGEELLNECREKSQQLYSYLTAKPTLSVNFLESAFKDMDLPQATYPNHKKAEIKYDLTNFSALFYFLQPEYEASAKDILRTTETKGTQVIHLPMGVDSEKFLQEFQEYSAEKLDLFGNILKSIGRHMNFARLYLEGKEEDPYRKGHFPGEYNGLILEFTNNNSLSQKLTNQDRMVRIFNPKSNMTILSQDEHYKQLFFVKENAINDLMTIQPFLAQQQIKKYISEKEFTFSTKEYNNSKHFLNRKERYVNGVLEELLNDNIISEEDTVNSDEVTFPLKEFMKIATDADKNEIYELGKQYFTEENMITYFTNNWDYAFK